MLEATQERLKAQVPDLGEVEQALDLTRLLKERGLPQHSTAYVVPLGMTGRRAEAATSIFRQEFTETVGVLLVERVRDRTGERAMDEVRPKVMGVLNALAGWSPGPELGVYELRAARLVSVSNGALLYMIELSINDQLRITET